MRRVELEACQSFSGELDLAAYDLRLFSSFVHYRATMCGLPRIGKCDDDM